MNRLWATLADRRLVLLTLLCLLILQAIAFLLPQIPVSARETAAFNRWLAELQPRLGDATRPLASLGLLTIRNSLLIRLGLSCLALIVAANLDRLRRPQGLAEENPAPERTNTLARILIVAGGIVLIGGWVGQMLWGWRDPEVIAWPGEALAMPERGVTIRQPAGPVGLINGQYGIYVLARGQRIGLGVQVTDDSGALLPLLPSVQEAPQETLRLAFTTRDPEAFFAVPDADLILRLNEIAETIQIQAYRSASGDLLAETQLTREDAGAVLDVDEVTATFDVTLLPRYEVIYNPGAVAEAAGLLVGALGGFMLKSPADEGQDDDASAPGDETG